MSAFITAFRLVHSLSGPEKKQFRQMSLKRKGEKDYVILFDLLESVETQDETELIRLFRDKNTNASPDNTARYLVKLITDSLISTKVEKDHYFHLLQGLMRVKVLQERSLSEEAFRELNKLKTRAEATQNHIVHYLTARMELNHLSVSNFPDISDKELVNMQMKTKSSLRTLHHIEDHYSLYELLRYRLIHSGRAASDEDRKKLNDLLLSEVSLVAGKVKNSLESSKLHLLFQSFFFTNVGDYHSALKTFNELNRLFDNNPDFREYPPMDYYASLEGILDNLRTAGEYLAMEQYVEKLHAIDLQNCPDYFSRLVRKTAAVYQLAWLTGERKIPEAITIVNSLDKELLQTAHLMHDEKQWELYFYASLTYFLHKDLKKAHQWIRKISTGQSRFAMLSICKCIRLLNIIIHYELKDLAYLDYEIRSYKRFFHRKNRVSKTEKMIFKTIQLNPNTLSVIKKKLLAPQIIKYVKDITADKYEQQLLKYFRFDQWAAQKFEQAG